MRWNSYRRFIKLIIKFRFKCGQLELYLNFVKFQKVRKKIVNYINQEAGREKIEEEGREAVQTRVKITIVKDREGEYKQRQKTLLMFYG